MNYPSVVETASTPNWEAFYCALMRLGPIALNEIPKEWIRWLQREGAESEWLWSEDIEVGLFECWNESPEIAVREAIARYVESVQSALVEFPYDADGAGWLQDPSTGLLMDRSECIARISCDPLRPRILNALVAAALQPSKGE